MHYKKLFLIILALFFYSFNLDVKSESPESQIKITGVAGLKAPDVPLADTSKPDVLLDASLEGKVNVDVSTIRVPDGTEVKVKFKDEANSDPPSSTVQDSMATIPITLKAGYTKVIYAETGPFIQPPPWGIDGLKLWLKADVIQGLQDGQKVAIWQDSSDNQNNVSASLESQKPTYKTQVINGLPILRWDENNSNVLETSTDIVDETKPLTVYAVAKLRSTSENIAVLFSDSSNSLFSGVCCWGDKDWKLWTPTIQNFTIGSVSEGFKYYTFIIRATTNKSDTVTLRQNSTAFGNSTLHTREGGGHLWVGGTPNGGGSTQGWAGDIAEFLVYEGEHTQDEITKIESYLKEKYRL